MKLLATVLICALNPLFAYVVIEYLGLGADAVEYIFFESPVLPYYFILITIEFITMLALNVVRVPILTSQLVFLIWLSLISHLSALLVLELQTSLAYFVSEHLIYEYVTALYPIILMILQSGIVFFLVVECVTRINLGYYRRNR